MNSTHKTLIIAPAWVGDAVMSQVLLSFLKQQSPNTEIHVLAPKWTAPIFECMPEVNRVISFDLKHGEFGLFKRYKIGKALRSEKYVQAIVLPNSWKSALIPFFSCIPKRTGFRGEMRYGLLNDMRILNQEKYPLMIERFLVLGMANNETLLSRYIWPKLALNHNHVNQTVKQFKLNLNLPIIVLCPGAEYGPAKRWPVNYFAEVANYFLEKNCSVWLMGSPKDNLLGIEIAKQTCHRVVNLISRTTLLEAVHLLSLADLVITNDSGLMHVSCALEKPTVAIYGSSSTTFTPPLNQRVKIVSLKLDCSPCFQRECPLKHFKCMLDLKPEKIIEASKQLLNE